MMAVSVYPIHPMLWAHLNPAEKIVMPLKKGSSKKVVSQNAVAIAKKASGNGAQKGKKK